MTELTSERKQILLEGINDFNDTLVTQSINIAGQAFNNALKLGCGGLAIPLVITLAIVQYTRRLDFSGFFVFSCVFVSLALVFAALVANRAKYLALQEKFQQDVGPDIDAFLTEHGFTAEDFHSLADEILADNAPLRQYLAGMTAEPKQEA